jgi:Glycosyl transferase family 2
MSSKKPTTSISVAMATYNGERFLRQQLDSLAAQKYFPSELIISDDASSDKTITVAEQFAETAPFTVRIYRHDSRVGYSANFMRAAALCTSDLIAFCDQDDIWSPLKLASCVESFRDPEVLLVYHNAQVVTETGEPLNRLEYNTSRPIAPPLSLCLLPSYYMNFAFGFTEVFRRSIMEFSDAREMSLSFNDLHAPMTHDQWVFFVASVFGSIVYLDKVLASYRQHGSNVVGWRPAQDIFSNLPQLLYNPAGDLHVSQQAAEKCAEILEKPRQTLTHTWQQRARSAASQYRVLANLYAARKSLYTSATIADRVKAFLSIVSRSGYKPKPSWGLGRAALVRDFCIGLPAGHLLQSVDAS